MEHQCPESPVSWFGLSMRRGGPRLRRGVHASSDALSCGASWPMLGGTICALGNLRNLKDLWGKQNPTPKQQAWGILGRLGAACLVLSLCVDNWHGMQHMEICSSARLLLQFKCCSRENLTKLHGKKKRNK